MHAVNQFLLRIIDELNYESHVVLQLYRTVVNIKMQPMTTIFNSLSASVSFL